VERLLCLVAATVPLRPYMCLVGTTSLSNRLQGIEGYQYTTAMFVEACAITCHARRLGALCR